MRPSTVALGAMTSVQANGITIEYDEVGTGEPLLLVMGLNGQLIDWPAAFVDALVERNFRVIRFDNRDAGLSTEVHAPAPTPWQIARSAVLPRRSKPAYTVPDLARAYPAHLHIDLLPAAQGIGAGRRLMAALETELVRVGAGGVHLGTSPRNVRSQGFYEHLGYRRLAPGELGTPDGAVLYVKAL